MTFFTPKMPACLDRKPYDDYRKTIDCRPKLELNFVKTEEIKFGNDGDQGSAADILSFSSSLITFCLFGHKLY